MYHYQGSKTQEVFYWCHCTHHNSFIEQLLEKNNQYQRSIAVCICGGLRFHYEFHPVTLLHNRTFEETDYTVQKPITIRRPKPEKPDGDTTSHRELSADILELSTWTRPYSINIISTPLVKK
jgi:hypothetical protein